MKVTVEVKGGKKSRGYPVSVWIRVKVLYYSPTNENCMAQVVNWHCTPHLQSFHVIPGSHLESSVIICAIINATWFRLYFAK